MKKRLLLCFVLTSAAVIGVARFASAGGAANNQPGDTPSASDRITIPPDESKPAKMCNAQGGSCSDWRDCCSGSCNSSTSTCN
jgi:hypothetical protein